MSRAKSCAPRHIRRPPPATLKSTPTRQGTEGIGVSLTRLGANVLLFDMMMDLVPMNDAQIRAATKQKLWVQHRGDAETVIFEELSVQHGFSRIDLAVVNGELQGFELKSDRDTLSRLPQQAEAFSRVFDRVTLVVGERLLRRAVEVVPDWWGIRVVRVQGGELHFSDLRHPINNPEPDATSIAMLLWRDEALSLLEKWGYAMGVRSKARAEIYSRVCEKVSLDDLRHWVRRCLRQRRDWRSVATRLSSGG